MIVDLDSLKAWLKVTGTASDDLLTAIRADLAVTNDLTVTAIFGEIPPPRVVAIWNA